MLSVPLEDGAAEAHPAAEALSQLLLPPVVQRVLGRLSEMVCFIKEELSCLSY